MFHQRKNINRKESPHAVNEITAKCKMFIWPSKHNILVDYNWTVACILQPDFSLIYGAKVNDRQGQQKFLRDSELLSIPFCREGEKTCMLMIGLSETHELKWDICGSVPGSQTACSQNGTSI